MSSFHVQGAVPLSSPAYVPREFERQLLAETYAARWTLLLGPRQHGKSSGLLRVRKDLISAGLKCALVDLQAMPARRDISGAVAWFCSAIARDLRLADYSSATQPEGEIFAHLSALPLDDARVVVIVDEAGAIEDERVRNNFFAQLRAIVNRRARVGRNDISSRLTCIFAGTFRPERLVDPINSPFNVCERVETQDLSLEDAQILWRGVAEETPGAVESSAFDLVGGQPYLLQRIYGALLGHPITSRAAAFAEAAERLQLGRDSHFLALFARIREDAALFALVRRLLAGDVIYEAANIDMQYLETLGFAHRVGGLLTVRNKLYREIANTAVGHATEQPFPRI